VQKRSNSACDAQKERCLILQQALSSVKIIGAQCVICSVFASGATPNPQTHTLLACPKTRQRCFKCLDDSHMSIQCPNKVSLQTRGAVCYKCLFPKDTAGHGAMAECPAMFLDKVIPSCWYWYRFARQLPLLQSMASRVPPEKMSSPATFATWLTNENAETALLNAFILYTNLVNAILTK